MDQNYIPFQPYQQEFSPFKVDDELDLDLYDNLGILNFAKILEK